MRFDQSPLDAATLTWAFGYRNRQSIIPRGGEFRARPVIQVDVSASQSAGTEGEGQLVDSHTRAGTIDRGLVP